MRKVLVVEDDESARRLLVEVLQERSEIEVECARDGVEALHLLSTAAYDVVILDVMMPKISGIDLLDALQAVTSDPSIRLLQKAPAVVVITAAADSALPNEAIERHCPQAIRAILRKPVDPAVIARCVERAMEK